MTEQATKYLVYRRDHAGNRDVVKLRDGDGQRFCWNLSEIEANADITRVMEDWTKPHGQMIDKLPYPEGTLKQFLEAEGIRY